MLHNACLWLREVIRCAGRVDVAMGTFTILAIVAIIGSSVWTSCRRCGNLTPLYWVVGLVAGVAFIVWFSWWVSAVLKHHAGGDDA